MTSSGDVTQSLAEVLSPPHHIFQSCEERTGLQVALGKGRVPHCQGSSLHPLNYFALDFFSRLAGSPADLAQPVPAGQGTGFLPSTAHPILLVRGSMTQAERQDFRNKVPKSSRFLRSRQGI